MKVEDILEKLEKKGRPDQLDSMARYGIVGEKRFGVSMPDLKILAREIGKDHNLALDLWKTGFQDARLLAAMIDCPEAVIETQMEEWVKDFDSWDVCDGVISYLFEKVPYAKKKIFDWAVRKEEFVKRAAFSLIAIIAIRDKKAPDIDFIRFLNVVRIGAKDNRNIVKKAVSWALRNIGKRNVELNKAAIETALNIKRIDSTSARWVASDAIRELRSEAVQKRLKKKIKND